SSAATDSRPHFLELFWRLRPILLQQHRERTIREQLAARLAARTVIRLVIGITNALYFASAHRTGLFEFPMHGHLGPERGYVLRKTVAGFPPQELDPVAECFLRGAVQPLDLLLRQCVGQSDRR